MPKTEPIAFNCPNCGVLYDLVKIEAEPTSADREISCLSCGGPLQGREGRFILKYFFVEKSGRRRFQRRQSVQSRRGI